MWSYPLNWYPLKPTAVPLTFLGCQHQENSFHWSRLSSYAISTYSSPAISMLHTVGICSNLCLSRLCFEFTFSSSVKVPTLSEQSVLLSLKKDIILKFIAALKFHFGSTVKFLVLYIMIAKADHQLILHYRFYNVSFVYKTALLLPVFQ